MEETDELVDMWIENIPPQKETVQTVRSENIPRGRLESQANH